MNSYTYIYNELKKLASNECSFSLTKSDDILHGDYATNIAFVFAKENGISPKEYAESIFSLLEESLKEKVQKIEIAGPGFINFFLKDDVVREENAKEEITIQTKYTGQNILVEHSSPNLFKPFNIGHLMNNFIGEFIVRAIKTGGGNVEVMAFPSDVSLGVAKALFIIEKDIKENKKDFDYFKNGNEDEVIKYFGEAYVRGVNECDESEESLNEAKKVLDKMYNLKDDSFYDLITITRNRNESYFKRVLNEIGSNIKSFVYEREAGAEGEKIVKENIGKVFTESEGAIVYIPHEDRKDINTSVFINSQGYPTYEAKDLGLIDIKFSGKLSSVGINNFYPDLSLFVTDAEQIQHFRVVFDAAEKLGSEWSNRIAKSKHIPHGRMLFKGAKMSSRLGGVPLALDVINTVEEEVKERAGEKIAHLTDEEKMKLERDISLSALRIAVLRSKPGININFDPETSLSFEGDSGPYLMYTHARCCSLLEKGKDILPTWSNIPVTALEKNLLHFERELIDVCEELAPQKLVSYLFSVAQLFNGYYAQQQILVEGDNIGNAHRLMIVKRTQEVLKRGLYVLGIKAVEKM